MGLERRRYQNKVTWTRQKTAVGQKLPEGNDGPGGPGRTCPAWGHPDTGRPGNPRPSLSGGPLPTDTDSNMQWGGANWLTIRPASPPHLPPSNPLAAGSLTTGHKHGCLTAPRVFQRLSTPSTTIQLPQDVFPVGEHCCPGWSCFVPFLPGCPPAQIMGLHGYAKLRVLTPTVRHLQWGGPGLTVVNPGCVCPAVSNSVVSGELSVASTG